MNRGKIAKKSGLIGLVSQLFLTITSLALRKILIEYMGVQYLGINSTLMQILGTLALSELGVQTVVVYKLFKPVAENDVDKINEIMSFFKKIYMFTAGIIIVGSILICPFLGFVIKDVTVDMFIVRGAWIIMALSSGCSYLLSYNRALLCADQKEYITKLVDLLSTVICVVIKIIVIIFTRNFMLYVLVDIFNMLFSNIVILNYRRKAYPWLKKTITSKELKKDIFTNVKDVIFGRLSGYVFNSTDSIVISSLISTVYVGLLGNYTTITVALKSIVYSIAAPIQNLIGNYLVKEEGMDVEKLLKKYEYIIYVIMTLLFIPTLLLISDFVYIFYGAEYELTTWIVFLLIGMEYTTLVQIPVGALVDASGLFKEQKKFMLISAIINIVLSVIGALTIGISGVLVGTMIGNIYNWVMRTRLSYLKVIRNPRRVLDYIWRNVGYFGGFIIVAIFIYFIFDKVFINVGIMNFVIKGVVAECIIILLHIIVFGRTEEFRYIKNLALRR